MGVMKIVDPVTILSDLHVGHSASFVSDPEQLASIFAESRTVIFNGDTVEMLWVHNRERARDQLRRVIGVCRREGARPVFVNGNHDPFLSGANHLDLAGGAVLVTHGDILFHEIAPWSRDARILGPKRARFLDRVGADGLLDLEKQLLASKWASLSLEMREPSSPNGRFPHAKMILREAWPPWRVFGILQAWSETPGRAARLLRLFRPRARFLILGHTHRAGAWTVDGRIIVNTGSYLPLSRRFAVRVEGESLTLREVLRRGSDFRLGREVARHRIVPLDEDADPAACPTADAIYSGR